MKYKLKTTVVGATAGTIFEYHKNEETEGVTLWEGESIGYLLDLIKIVGIDNKEYFEEIIEKPKSVFNLKDGDIMYFINQYGEVKFCHINGYEDEYIKYGNIYLTEQEAQKVLNKRIALQNIKKYCWENDIEIYEDFRKGAKNYISYYNNSYNITYIIDTNSLELFYLTSSSDYETIIENCKDDLDILFDNK